jgi:cell division protein FtsB
MAENKLKRIFYSKAMIFVLLLAFIWLSITLVRATYKKYQLDQEIVSVKNEMEKLDKKGQELNQMLDYFNSQNSLEKEAKEKLNLKKEGETVVMINENSFAQEAAILPVTTTAQGDDNFEKDENNLIKWWKYFFVR